MSTTTDPFRPRAHSCTQCGSVFETNFKCCPWDGSPLRAGTNDQDMVGRKLGCWTIRRFVGGGGMGRVYEALSDDGRRGALKTLASDLLNSAQGRRRFVREAEALRRLRHKNVVSVLDCDVDTVGPSFMVMEFCEGPTLLEVLKSKGRLDFTAVIRLMADIARGLGHAHAQGLVHRDLKPENIVLSPSPEGEQPKILDFGVVRMVDDNELDAITQAGHLVGTPLFMAPEQVLGDRVGPAADFYSLGVLAYLMLEGRPQFAGEGAQLLRNALQQAPAPMVADVPPWLESIVHRLLEKDPELRLGSADALLSLLQQQPLPSPKPEVDSTEVLPRRTEAHADLDLMPSVSGVETADVLSPSFTEPVVRTEDTVLHRLPPPRRRPVWLVPALTLAILMAGATGLIRQLRSPTEAVLVQDVVPLADATRPPVNESPVASPDAVPPVMSPPADRIEEPPPPPTAEPKPEAAEPKPEAAEPKKNRRLARRLAPPQAPAPTTPEPPAPKIAKPSEPNYEQLVRECAEQLQRRRSNDNPADYTRWRSKYFAAVVSGRTPGPQRIKAQASLRVLAAEVAKARAKAEH